MYHFKVVYVGGFFSRYSTIIVEQYQRELNAGDMRRMFSRLSFGLIACVVS